MNATIMARLGCDTSGFSKPLRDAGDTAEREHRRMANSARGNAAAHERLLESNNRVTNQVAGFARTMLNARSATDVVSAGLDRLENSLNLSLGKGVALAGAAILISKVGELRGEYQQLRKEMESSLSPKGDPSSRGMTDIEASLANAIQLSEKLKNQTKDKGLWGKAMTWAGDIGRSIGADSGTSVFDIRAQREKDIAAQQGNIAGERGAQAAKINDQARISRLGGNDAAKAQLWADYNVDYAAAAKDGNGDKISALYSRLTASLDNLEKTIRSAQLERTQLKLSDLASYDGQVVPGMKKENWERKVRDSESARNVLAWEAEGARRADLYDQKGSAEAFSRADEIRKGISGLKESEKDLTGAINSSELVPLLQSIDKKVGPAVNR